MTSHHRYARHWILQEVGHAGQKRIEAFEFTHGSSIRSCVAADYLKRAGATHVASAIPLEALDGSSETRINVDTNAAEEVVDGCFLALEALRRVIGRPPAAPLRLNDTEE